MLPAKTRPPEVFERIVLFLVPEVLQRGKDMLFIKVIRPEAEDGYLTPDIIQRLPYKHLSLLVGVACMDDEVVFACLIFLFDNGKAFLRGNEVSASFIFDRRIFPPAEVFYRERQCVPQPFFIFFVYLPGHLEFEKVPRLVKKCDAVGYLVFMFFVYFLYHFPQ